MLKRNQALALAAVFALLGSTNVYAQKKPGGGGGGGETTPAPSGTIYFIANDDTGFMPANGTPKTPLPANVSGAPSQLLHGTYRWFVQKRWMSYPSGTTQHVFAVREDGEESLTVQLTSDPAMELTSDLSWSPDDQFVSWTGRRWLSDGTVDINSVGLYVGTVVFDGDGNANGLAAAPSLLVSLGTTLDSAGNWISSDSGYDWSPDLTQIVYGDVGGLRIADLVTGQDRLLINEGGSPLWSPDGSRIAYYNFTTSDVVVTIAPNGSGRKTIAKGGRDYGVSPSAWSPTGTHLLFFQWCKDFANYQGSDIFRITASGGDKVNLTSDIAEDSGAIGWRL